VPNIFGLQCPGKSNILEDKCLTACLLGRPVACSKIGHTSKPDEQQLRGFEPAAVSHGWRSCKSFLDPMTLREEKEGCLSGGKCLSCLRMGILPILVILVTLVILVSLRI
jgi:hypothetical protein